MNAQEMRDRLRDFVRSELLREPDYPLAARLESPREGAAPRGNYLCIVA